MGLKLEAKAKITRIESMNMYEVEVTIDSIGYFYSF